ncbi:MULTISPECIES: Rqc2 family fibronectin-binding protein [Prochlorococcus]|uniref:Rqc2 family fibronectin-binding protein n=1 Tax=Prochlorococcus TaxID=1218 RepID=UPI0005337E75|nr:MULTISPECIES: NFACT RNA binding domain-containing protein [Prochlorococcus]KGG12927.1 putative secreted protein MPB70 precursor [Prochlorococcus sp. MIT 0601]
MDITSIKAVVVELRKKIIPSRFEKAQQPEANTLQIGLRTIKELIWIELSWDAYSARLVEIAPPPKTSGESTLAKQVNHGLNQMALIDLKQKGFERVIEFHFGFRPKEKSHRSLILELMGRHSNFLMLNKEGKTITLGKQVREYQSRLRPISTGDIYTPPPPLNGKEPNKDECFEDWKERLSLIPISLKEALLMNYQGISPSLAIQLASDKKETAEQIVNLSVKDLAQETWESIYKRWHAWLEVCDKESFCICSEGPTAYRVWKEGNEKLAPSSALNISLFLGKYYRSHLEQKRFNKLFDEMNQRLIKERINEEKSLIKQKGLLTRVKESDEIQRKADSILSSHKPSKAIIKEAQLLYKKAKKIRRSESMLIERVNFHQKKLALIAESELFVHDIILNTCESNLEKIHAISELKEELDKHLFSIDKNSSKPSYTKKINLVLEIISPNGLSIQIGRNHRQNELISIKNARKGDFWFHAQECPGGHVVIKASQGGGAEESDIQFCADLAAYFSKARHSKKVSITMVPIKQLQKLKGAIPGTVTHRGGKVLWGDPLNGKDHFERSRAKAQNALSSATS